VDRFAPKVGKIPKKINLLYLADTKLKFRYANVRFEQFSRTHTKSNLHERESHSHSPQTTNIWVRLNLRGLGGVGRGVFLGEVLCASCRYEGKTKGNIGVLMHVLPLVFVAAATCWEKTRGCSLCLRHFGGTGGGLIDLGTDPPHAPTYPTTTHPSVTHPPKCLLSEWKRKPNCSSRKKTETCNNGHKKGREASWKLTLIRFRSAGVSDPQYL